MFRFAERGDLLKVVLTDGSDCIDFSTGQAFCIRVFKITGGTRRLECRVSNSASGPSRPKTRGARVQSCAMLPVESWTRSTSCCVRSRSNNRTLSRLQTADSRRSARSDRYLNRNRAAFRGRRRPRVHVLTGTAESRRRSALVRKSGLRRWPHASEIRGRELRTPEYGASFGSYGEKLSTFPPIDFRDMGKTQVKLHGPARWSEESYRRACSSGDGEPFDGVLRRRALISGPGQSRRRATSAAR